MRPPLPPLCESCRVNLWPRPQQTAYQNLDHDRVRIKKNPRAGGCSREVKLGEAENIEIDDVVWSASPAAVGS